MGLAGRPDREAQAGALGSLWITLCGARFSRKSRRSCGATRVTVAVATAEGRNARDAAFPAKPWWDGPFRATRYVSARSFGTTKPRSPKPQPVIPERLRRARTEFFRGSLVGHAANQVTLSRRTSVVGKTRESRTGLSQFKRVQHGQRLRSLGFIRFANTAKRLRLPCPRRLCDGW